MPDHPGQNRFAHINDFASGAAAHRTEADQVRVKVAASGTFDRVCLKVFADQQGLHFSHFQRPQHTPQSRDARGRCCAPGSAGFDAVRGGGRSCQSLENLLRLRANFVSADVSHVGMKIDRAAPDYVGMQLRLELRAVTVLATKNPFLEEAFFQGTPSMNFGDRLEMLAGFVIDAALGMAAVVAGKAVAAAFARKRLKQVLRVRSVRPGANRKRARDGDRPARRPGAEMRPADEPAV